MDNPAGRNKLHPGVGQSDVVWFLVPILCIVLNISCKEQSEPLFNAESITVATFNIAWLGDGQNDRKPRTEADYDLICETILDSRADVLALQEVENADALDKLTERLPGFDYVIGSKRGPQNTAVLYRKGIDVHFVDDYDPLVVSSRLRPGLIVKCRANNFDWLMMVVHFKSTSRFDSTKELRKRSRQLRTRQAEITANWIDSVLAQNGEDDIMIVGDFNDSPGNERSPTLQPLLVGSIEFLTMDLQSCKRKIWKVIDHIAISAGIRKRFIEGSVGMINFYNSHKKTVAARISDHCPVLARFEVVSADDD